MTVRNISSKATGLVVSNTTDVYREYTPCPRNSSYSFKSDPFETLQVLKRWSEDMHVVFL